MSKKYQYRAKRRESEPFLDTNIPANVDHHIINLLAISVYTSRCNQRKATKTRERYYWTIRYNSYLCF